VVRGERLRHILLRRGGLTAESSPEEIGREKEEKGVSSIQLRVETVLSGALQNLS